MSSPSFSRCAALAATTLFIGAPGGARAGDVAVSVSGEGGPGAISCALFSSASSFPFGRTDARYATAAPEGGAEVCRFRGVAAGAYAVAVARLPAGQTGVTRDVLGRPRQPWGVSNNVHPVFRPPTFAEARFAAPSDGEVRLDVRIMR